MAKYWITEIEEFFTKLDKENKLFNQSNKAWIRGTMEKNLEYSHHVGKEEFYKTRVKVPRKSGVEDFVPIVVSEKYLPENFREIFFNQNIEVCGEFHSFRKLENSSKLELFLYAKMIRILGEKWDETKENNLIYLKGCLTKDPIFRETPTGKKIAQLSVVVNRKEKVDDYIPCIVWEEKAQFAFENLSKKSEIELYGRIQSRIYAKSYPEERIEVKYTYEISITRLTLSTKK